jgi:hypothetical protein
VYDQNEMQAFRELLAYGKYDAEFVGAPHLQAGAYRLRSKT